MRDGGKVTQMGFLEHCWCLFMGKLAFVMAFISVLFLRFLPLVLCEALCFLPSTSSTQNSSLYSGIGGSEEHGMVRFTGWQRGSSIFRHYWLM